MHIRSANIPQMFSEGFEEDTRPRTRWQWRQDLFAEKPAARSARLAAEAWTAMASCRLSHVKPLLSLAAHGLFGHPAGLPDVTTALRAPDGYCGLAGDLDPARLQEAYGCGLMPVAHFGLVGWWAPARRWALDPALAGSESAEDERLASGDFRFDFDRRFEQVLMGCAKAGRGLSSPLMQAFAALHDIGLAHSFEIHDRTGALAGGGFGVRVGGSFFVHSSFGRAGGAEKTAFFGLHRHLAAWHFGLCEARDASHLQTLGYVSRPRADLGAAIAANQGGGKGGRWSACASITAGRGA